jgi:hypothetical protein
MAKRTRSNISIEDRVDAVVEAMEIYRLFQRDCSRSIADSTPMVIVHQLRKRVIDRAEMRRDCDQLLAHWLEPAHLNAFARVHICKLENALGLAHDQRSVDAFLAFNSPETWRAYVDAIGEAQPPTIEIAIPARPGQEV